MIKRICIYIFLFFCFILNIIIDFNIKNYFETLNKCFGKNIVLSGNLYALICFIIALISILIVLDILLVLYKNKEENKGIKFISLEATDMGKPLYEKYGFIKMNNEMELTR